MKVPNLTMQLMVAGGLAQGRRAGRPRLAGTAPGSRSLNRLRT